MAIEMLHSHFVQAVVLMMMMIILLLFCPVHSFIIPSSSTRIASSTSTAFELNTRFQVYSTPPGNGGEKRFNELGDQRLQDQMIQQQGIQEGEERELDPLIKSLTRMDPVTANAPTRNVPLLGEIPVDGSLFVLAPAAIIGVLGFLMSINIAFQSRDIFIKGLEQIAKEMSRPPVKEVVAKDSCRGLCSNQEDQLKSMRRFMENLSSKNNVASGQTITTSESFVDDKAVISESSLDKSDISTESPVIEM